ncbi:alcohol dehydrogenase catalytic domain-containing protein [Nonomuraea sp. KM88]|uniref:alcohol dehydrogenase catalytic domain-containing protein n=1 Tax=Nonomuraea sp. KM88 TaxID=3457427 RepID=UPI003FCD99A0
MSSLIRFGFRFAYVPGTDFTGTVTGLGPGVTSFAAGKYVVSMPDAQASLPR